METSSEYEINGGDFLNVNLNGANESFCSMLAELMLPDQAHVRFQDWTIFFLHKEEEESGDPVNQQPLVYVLNLVNTKHDKKEKR